MSIFMRIADIEGESQDTQHRGWIRCEEMESQILRSIPKGARDQQRTKGETVLPQVVVVRRVDVSSPGIQLACATGEMYDDLHIHLCSTTDQGETPYMMLDLDRAIISSYHLSINESGHPLPTERIGINFTHIEWVYQVLDPDSGHAVGGKIVGQYDPGAGAAGGG